MQTLSSDHLEEGLKAHPRPISPSEFPDKGSPFRPLFANAPRAIRRRSICDADGLALPSLIAQAVAPFVGALLVAHGGAPLTLLTLAIFRLVMSRFRLRYSLFADRDDERKMTEWLDFPSAARPAVPTITASPSQDQAKVRGSVSFLAMADRTSAASTASTTVAPCAVRIPCRAELPFKSTPSLEPTPSLPAHPDG